LTSATSTSPNIWVCGMTFANVGMTFANAIMGREPGERCMPSLIEWF